MKEYIAPKLICMELRSSENIAVGECNGSCTEEEAIEHGLVYLVIS